MEWSGFSKYAGILLLSLLASSGQASASSFSNGTSFLLNNSTGNATVIDPLTGNDILQGSDSDGAGDGFDAANAIWVVFLLAVGAPTLLAGVRMGRITSGIGFAVSMAAILWASVINTVSEGSIPDIIIAIITIIVFFVGFAAGVMSAEYRIGSTMLSAAGGISVMIRIVLFRSGLLIPAFTADWIVCAIAGIFGLVLVMLNERWGVIIGSSALGSFLSILAVDLVINKQSGMSLGLRFLFDRNEHHLAALFNTGYNPPLSSIVLLAISLALVPIFSFIQHKVFPVAFWSSHDYDPTGYDDASIRSTTWIGRLRGRKRYASPVEDKSASQQELIGARSV